MEKKNLKDWALNNIETVLNVYFQKHKLTKSLREQLASEMAIIASNAYRMGYYAHSIDTENQPLLVDDFDCTEQPLLSEITWRIQEAGK